MIAGAIPCTEATGFRRFDASGRHDLMRVSEGTPAVRAVEQAGQLVDQAIAIVSGVVADLGAYESDEATRLSGAEFILDAARALVNSIEKGLQADAIRQATEG